MSHATAGAGRVVRGHAGPDIWCEDLVRIFSIATACTVCASWRNASPRR